MANFLNGFLDNLSSGLLTPKGNLGDFQHAARLYNANSFRLAPKTKYLYHVVLNINPDAIKSTTFRQQHMTAINLLVKNVDLPSFKVSVSTVHQYNRKKQVQTKLDYDPVNIIFHDDNLGVTTQLWSLYYGYYFADSSHGGSAGSIAQAGSSGITGFLGSLGGAFEGAAKLASGVNNLLGRIAGPGGSSEAGVPAAYQRNTYKGEELNKFRYGLDNNSSAPFFSSIQIFQLSRHQYQSYTLINPIITSWQHEKLDQADTTTPSANAMTIAYEAVIYGQGAVSEGNPKGFATEYYDKSPSPLTLAGGGTTSLFGQGGVLGGLGDVLGDLGSGRAFTSAGAFLGTLIKGTNTVNNAKNLSKEGIRQESFGIIKGAIGQATGINVSGVANTVFPKNNGSGQLQTTKALGTPNTNTSSLTARDLGRISTSPALLNSISSSARITGAVPTSATNAEISALLESGTNPKLNGLARRTIGAQ
jgi:hypothetical protein